MTSQERDYGRDLYPFLYAEEGDTAGAHMAAVLESARDSTMQKCGDIVALRSQLLHDYRDRLVEAAEAMARAFMRGGRLLAFGNGGSATDAEDAVSDCLLAPVVGWRSLPAISLTRDIGVITGVANDVGFEHVFLRQIIALAEPADIALGISTSGASANVVAAFGEAKRRGILTIGFAGCDGGAMLRSGTVDYCFVARHDYIPRIQEGHATLWHTLLELVQVHMSHASK